MYHPIIQEKEIPHIMAIDHQQPENHPESLKNKPEQLNNQAICKKILVVDDDRMMRDMVSKLLSLLGYAAFIFGDAIEALSFFKKDTIEVVLTDLEMPGLNGWEFAHNIKKHAPFTPIILMTGVEKEAVEVGMKKGHVDFVLNKPFKMKDLNKVISEAFETRCRVKI